MNVHDHVCVFGASKRGIRYFRSQLIIHSIINSVINPNQTAATVCEIINPNKTLP
jgi:hypothetical protein